MLKSGEVPVSAEDYWAAVLDWGAVLEWMPKDSPPVPIKRCELEVGHRPGVFPCTRILHVDMAKLPLQAQAAVPSALRETVRHADGVAKFLYYTLDSPAPFGLRNYVATTEVNDIGSNRAYVVNSGRGDLPIDVPPEPIVALFEDTYARAIIEGIGRYALQRRQ
jgi:hypothetical protein